MEYSQSNCSSSARKSNDNIVYRHHLLRREKLIQPLNSFSPIDTQGENIQREDKRIDDDELSLGLTEFGTDLESRNFCICLQET